LLAEQVFLGATVGLSNSGFALLGKRAVAHELGNFRLAVARGEVIAFDRDVAPNQPEIA
jgi:hypothetical protein